MEEMGKAERGGCVRPPSQRFYVFTNLEVLQNAICKEFLRGFHYVSKID